MDETLFRMVSQQQINEYYTKSHKRILELTEYYIFKFKKYHIDKLAYINESYLYLISQKENIEVEQIESYVLMFIKNNIIWNNSKLYKQETIRESEKVDDIHDEHNETNEYHLKLDAIIEVYENESDQIKKIIHEVVLYKEKNSCRKMAEHFNIDKGQANKLLKQLKLDINEKFNTKKRIYE